MLHFIIPGPVLTAAIIMVHCVLQTVSHTGENLPDNFIGFDSAPDKVADGSVVRVRYLCSRPCQLGVEVVASTFMKTDLVVFRRKWNSSVTRVYRVHQVQLKWPPSILHRHDFFNSRVLDAQNLTLCAWLYHLIDGSGYGTYHESSLRSCKVLQIKLLSERPVCPSWSAQLIWRMTSNRIHHCPHESDTITMLNFPLASTGERFGVVRKFQPFINRVLERARLHAVTKPSVTLSLWIYLLKWCQEKLCGIIHHIDRNNSYGSILMQLTDTGNVIIQACLKTGEDEAFQAHVVLPLRKWIRLDCYIQDTKVLLDTTWDYNTNRYAYQFQDRIHYDDTDGYFVIGGGKYISGIRGYFGPVKYYRLGSEEVRNPESTLHELDKTHQECQEIKMVTRAFLKQVTESHRPSIINKGVCMTPYIKLGQFGEKSSTQTWTWEKLVKYSMLFKCLQTKAEEIRTGSLGMKELGSILFQQAVDALFTVDHTQSKISSKSAALLQASSCFGNHKASLLLAAIHLSGLGPVLDQQQGHVYSLIGAVGDNRFALMHAGYKHTHGIDGFPKDLDMAYSYYSNAGAQSSIDISRIHDQKQYPPEHIYLSNQEELHGLNPVKSGFFDYLKFQAERGDVDAQKRLALMLYWGQHGVLKDAEGGVKWFRRSAMQMKDPSAMYDYSILLMKGQGVKRNYIRGVQLLEKAAAMGSINALNGLGWYHGIILKNHRKAVKYFEQAALNGNADGMFNLGVYHLSGENPNSPWRNETAAFQQFLKASLFGHAAASVEAAWYLSTGSLEGVSQDVDRAVIMLKTVCEQNGHLGFMIREALNAYLQGSWQEAFVKYVLAAETGLGLAQSNVAHLCEELNLSLNCQWRYLNYTILNYEPHPHALLKMGDYYYYSYYSSSSTRKDSLSLVGQAISMYSRAARAGSPQGMYNLVLLARQGHVLPLSIHGFFNVSRHDEQDVVLEKILNRCLEAEDEEALMPCSVALLGVRMGKALRRVTQNSVQLLLAYASILSVVVISVVVPLQSCLEQRAPRHRVVRPRARTLSPGQDGVNLNREQHGIMTRAYTTLRNQWLTLLNSEQRLRQTGDLAVTLSGACLCAFWTTLLYHLL